MKKVAYNTAVLSLLLSLSTTGFLFAQDQPTVAENNQDEIINIDRRVSDSAESFKILRSGDKQEINRYVTKVYALEHANPYEILPYLRTIATLEKGNVVTAWVPKEGEKSKAWIQVNVPDFQISSIDAAVAAYDVPDFASIPGDVKFSYRTKYRSAVEISDFIRTTTLSPDGKIIGDSSTNTIYVQDSPSDFRRVLAQIEFYDIPSPQLNVEVQIVELTETDQTSLGLDWDAWKTALSGGAAIAGNSTRINPPGDGVLNSSSRSYDGLLSVDATAAARFLNYLVDRGKAKIHVQTNLTVSNETISTVTSGTGVPSFSYAFNPGQARSVLTRNPGSEIMGEGLALAMVPVIAMNAARLDVAISLRSPVSINKLGEPIFSDQDIQAQLTLQNDQLFKLGGIRRGVETVQVKGFPLLKDIPVLKYLFSNESTIIRETELYVFIRPTWSTPVVPAMDSMQVDKPVQTKIIADIVRENPNLSISEEDMLVLDRYFNSVDKY